MKTINLFVLLSILLVFSISGKTQNNCYIQLGDLSGFNTAPYQAELEAAACELIQAFPSEFQEQFKVYSFGFYVHNEYMQGGFEEAFQKVADEIQTPYYLVIGRQTDHTGIYTRFWVELELPTTGEFECLELMSGTIRHDLVNKYKIKADQIYEKEGKTPEKYFIAEVEIINSLKTFTQGTIECCKQENLRSNILCTACILTDEEHLILQKSYDFFLDPVFITKDPDYFDLTSTIRPKDNSNNRNQYIPLNIDIKFQDGFESNLDQFLISYRSEQLESISSRTGINPDISIHTFKYPRDCGSFESIWQEYRNDNADYKILISIININNEVGVLGYHSTLSNLSDFDESSSFNNPVERIILKDEMEPVLQIQEDAGKDCEELVRAYAAFTGSLSPTFNMPGGAAPILTPDIIKLNSEVYSHTLKGLDEPKYNMGIHWAKEFAAVKAEPEFQNCSWWHACGIRSKWQTTENLCSGVIHTTLDMCGTFFEVCDGANAILYLISGDLKNAAYSTAALVPIAGMGATGIKHGAKLWKPLVGCAGGSSLRLGTYYCRVLTFSVKATGEINWGKKARLRSMMKGYLNMAGKEAHHLIPWELSNHPIMKILAEKGWHINNPVHNGLPIPIAFHRDGGHKFYREKLFETLNKMNGKKIIFSMSNSDAISTMNRLTDELAKEINKAIQKGEKIDDHFKKVNWDEIYNKI
jgi:hypothetical protein